MATAPKSKTHTSARRKKPTEHNTTTLLKERYISYLPSRKHHRLFLLISLIGLALVVIAQLLYPSERGLPWAKVGDTSLALATHSEMAQVITKEFGNSKVKLQVNSNKAEEYSLQSAGAEPNTEAMIEDLSTYPLWQRLIPGSLLWQGGRAKVAKLYYTREQLKKFAENQSQKLSFPAQDAHLAIKEGRLMATDGKPGAMVTGEMVIEGMNDTPLLLGGTTTITLPAKHIAPQRTAKDLAKVREKAETALRHQVRVTVSNKAFSPDQATLASWIVLATDGAGNTTLSVDKEKIKSYLHEVNSQVGTPAGQTNITIVDGREVNRTVGVTGQAINSDALTEYIANKLLTSSPLTISVPAAFVPVQPSVIFNSKYTGTQAGLQAYVEDVARTKNMRISIQQLDGGGWSAAARADESTPSGSTFKLFVALVLFDKIDKGEISWNDPMLDTTVAGCFERMTVASTNPCAEKWIAEFGRQYINDFIYARGFSRGTTFITNGAIRTTAADLTKFMIGLNNGTLIGGANRDRLLSSLGRHPYRDGIPTGSAGVVHDKVGFLWDYVHDTAIVQHPRGTYYMTVMTKGQSYAAIASVTREIERIMYP